MSTCSGKVLSPPPQASQGSCRWRTRRSAPLPFSQALSLAWLPGSAEGIALQGPGDSPVGKELGSHTADTSPVAHMAPPPRALPGVISERKDQGQPSAQPGVAKTTREHLKQPSLAHLRPGPASRCGCEGEGSSLSRRTEIRQKAVLQEAGDRAGGPQSPESRPQSVGEGRVERSKTRPGGARAGQDPQLGLLLVGARGSQDKPRPRTPGTSPPDSQTRARSRPETGHGQGRPKSRRAMQGAPLARDPRAPSSRSPGDTPRPGSPDPTITTAAATTAPRTHPDDEAVAQRQSGLRKRLRPFHGRGHRRRRGSHRHSRLPALLPEPASVDYLARSKARSRAQRPRRDVAGVTPSPPRALPFAQVPVRGGPARLRT